MFLIRFGTLGEDKLGFAGDRGVGGCSSEEFIDRSCGPLPLKDFEML